MGLLTFLATAALFLIGQSNLYEMASAQTVTPLSTANAIGQNVYLYNPASQTVLSPVEYTNGLTMVPLASYNDTMQWNIALDDSGPALLVSAVSSEVAGCSYGTAQLNAEKASPVTTLCTPNTSLYVNFLFITTRPNNYAIVPDNNAAACLTIVNDVPTTPPTVCSRLAADTQWQVVTIS